MGTHLFPRRLDRVGTAEPSYVVWSIEPADIAIFFIHGFRGAALATWREFDSLCPGIPEFKKADLIFLGYDSMRTQTVPSATRLLESCVEVIEDSAHLMNDSVEFEILHRPEHHKYRSIVFVAHSLGAIITRRLLIRAQNLKYSWVDDVRLVLFAPAHLGATNVQDFAKAVLNAIVPPFGGIFARYLLWKTQTLPELEEDSQTIVHLSKDSLQGIANRKAEGRSTHHLIASHVVNAEKEDIVNTNKFCEDPEARNARERTHVDVCKPTKKFLDPIDDLMNGLPDSR